MLRRLHPDQPASFAFTPENRAWAEAQMTKYPEGRQASAIIPLLWRAQEQEGWLTRPAIEHVADMLDMAYIRALEVATFYFMFQLQPVGSVAHVQVCGTTSCMICGAEDLVAVCRERIAAKPHQLSADGRFSWEEVECLGACANAPMAQIGKDYYEDLTAEKLAWILDELAAGRVPRPGPQNGRFASEPLGGVTSLKGDVAEQHNGSVALAVALEDTVRRIDGSEVPLVTPWLAKPAKPATNRRGAAPQPKPAAGQPVDHTGTTEQEARAETRAKPQADVATEALTGKAPRRLTAPEGAPDDLKQIKGVGPVLEEKLNALGIWHYSQIAAWGPDEIAWVDGSLNFKGRIDRDGWIEQAAALARGMAPDQTR
ncbi:MAG: NADH-quinone oxidoreductase subunit E [Pararhodobacter sp.]